MVEVVRGGAPDKRAQVTTRVEPDLATFQEREDAVGTAQWRTLEEKYLRLE